MSILKYLLILGFPICIFGQEIPLFTARVDAGIIENTDLKEISGLVASSKNKHVFWAHNDRNNQNRLFAFGHDGTHLAVFYLDGIQNRDWEDMAIGPGPDPDKEYLYIGDVGDNESVHEVKYIYRFEEPNVSFDQAPVENNISEVETIIFDYPDGKRDAETLLIDPLTKDLYVISKREVNAVRVYRAVYPQPIGKRFTLEHVNTLPLSQIVGGDVTSSGNEIILKSYTHVYYWKRNSNKPFWESLNQMPSTLPYFEELQGEAICWGTGASAYYTVTENHFGIPLHLYSYPRTHAGLVINEIMINPSAVPDANGEWIELFNNSEQILDLNGFSIMDSDLDQHTISLPLTIEPKGFLILGRNNDTTLNGGVNVDYQYRNFQLGNEGDEVILLNSKQEVLDSVAYDNGTNFIHKEGISLALKDPNVDNSLGFNWQNEDRIFGLGDMGSPGMPNGTPVLFAPITDIQYTSELQGPSPITGDRITVSGVVSVEPYGFFANNFWIQDSVGKWTGIEVHHTGGAIKGDSVMLTGMVEEARNERTMLIDISDFKIVSSGHSVQPVEVTTGEIRTGGINAEAYESVLVKVQGTCVNDNIGFKEWMIDDGTGPTLVYHAFLSEFQPQTGDDYEVVGIQFYRNGEFIILPRVSEAISGPLITSTDSINFSDEITLHNTVPNPFSTWTSISYEFQNSEKAIVNIYDIYGRLMATLENKNHPPGLHRTRWIPSINDANGIYFCKLFTSKGTLTKKMILFR